MAPNLNDREINALYDRLGRIESKIDELNEWRWKIIGMSAAVSAVIGTGIAVVGLV
jgi:hypothetical protein